MKKLLLIVFFSVFTATQAQNPNFWTPVSNEKAATISGIKPAYEKVKGKLFTVDAVQLRQLLHTAPERFSGGEGVVIAIPGVDGKAQHFRMFESSNFDIELQAQYPEIRAYAGNGIEDPSAVLRLSASPSGIQTMVLRPGKPNEYIEPYTLDAGVYIVFNAALKQTPKLPFTCFTNHDENNTINQDGMTRRSAMATDLVLRRFRLAVSVTGEYTQFFGGTVAGALAGINNTMTRVNGIYERDLAVKLELIANTTAVIYTNPATDPYTNINSWNTQLQNTLTSVLGNSAYDIGHLFAGSGGGGNAGCIGCVCVANQKGSAYTAPSGNPEGDTFDIDYVAHEMGHQLGATHSFSYQFENTGTNVEPGSGTTIMGYAGITGSATDVQSNSDAYFHYVSINQIQNNLIGKFCSVNTTLTNPPITINAGPNRTIPRGTAFRLRAVGAEANPSTVTYTWEQNDSGNSSTTGNGSRASATKTVGPNFRSFPPTTSPERFLPALSLVLNNQLITPWESVSNVNRTLTFFLTGRDNIAGGGQTKSDDMVVTVTNNAGPFTVTSQNTTGISWVSGSTQAITWNVAGTTGNGVNTSFVNIRLSTDGGLTYPILLAESTANDGSENITVPNVSAPFCRIMVEAVNNIFYALNSTTFAINFTVTNTCNTYTNANAVAIPDNATTYSTSFLNVPDNLNITDVNATVNITHTFIGDLVLLLVSPNNTQVQLWNQQCGTNNNMNVTFNDSGSAVTCASPTTGDITPAASLSAFNNLSSQGQWILAFADVGSGDTGTLNSWSLQICSQQITAGVNEFGLADFKLYPNPTNGMFTVEFTSETSNDVQVLVHDMRGRQILDTSYRNTGLFSANVDLQNAEAGVYLVTVQDGARKEVKRVVVQ
ncbi:hypothetical protein CHU92_11065 [Flavobacterium cyanobacteriorum]|uniref:P/Homo B domain-containing protein n=1 Tax=Flavobacterium cyanobacteriorum TaxID=2022802 RepID=A0A255Z0Y2_9FLAO|nr:zinc-dependent metalloprotease family protein [Flavobacterium cyanobacteriorum]OYQ35112.1 hypothetical protein CHU92_11065 [Flavobacterium cyanobacteriorum]